MPDNSPYIEIANKIVEQKIVALGSQALKVAKTVEGINIDNNGKIIDLTTTPKTAIQNILTAYKKISGRVAILSAITATVRLKTKYPELEMPEEMEWK